MNIHEFDEKIFTLPNGCWYWTATKSKLGYGQARFDSDKLEYAHRIAYRLWRGPIPEGLSLDHLCRNPSCVNPQHLDPVTHRENLLRGRGIAPRNAAVTHCPHGHEYTDENTVVRHGSRYCLICRKFHARARRASLGMVPRA